MASMAWRSAAPITVAFAYALLSYAAGNFRIAEYLQVPFYPFTGELTVVCAALVGAGLGFLWFNCHPAQVFMGDTGSLAIGGMIGVVAICCKQELLLAVVGGVFVIEAVSVILQVLSFKLTGKRIFAMSPHPSSFRTERLEGKHRHRALLDSFRDLRPARSGHFEVEIKLCVTTEQKGRSSGSWAERHGGRAFAQGRRRERSPCSTAPRSKTISSRPSKICARMASTVICGPAAETECGDLRFRGPESGHRSDLALAQNFSSRKIEMIGELELGWRSCEMPVIAITGTNGKTTTTELLAQMLNACGQRTIACGNIGKPLCEVVREQGKISTCSRSR